MSGAPSKLSFPCSPAKVVRPLKPEERASLKYWAEKYVANGGYCLQHGLNIGAPLAT